MAEGYVRRESSRPRGVPWGEEWSAPEDVDAILDSFLFPFVDDQSVVGEIGVGGGRIAARVAPHVGHFYGFDISPAMLDAARAPLAGLDNVDLVLLRDASLPEGLTGTIDFAYAFATFLHLDIHMMWRYFQEMSRVLRPGGHGFVHTATITTPAGWARFASQESFSVAGFYFVSPEIVRTIAGHAGFTLVKESEAVVGNDYLSRDSFALFRR